MDSAKFVVVGGGILGCAVAQRILTERPGAELMLLEKESEVAAHQTGHNSGVIHTGIYYKPGSNKAETCVRGRAAMIDFCRRHDIAHELCGKVVVATSEPEIAKLDELERRGRANGVEGLRRLDADGLREVEPHARGVSAMHVPGAGIVDYVEVTRKLRSLVEAAGGIVRTGARVDSIEPARTHVDVRCGDETIRADVVVACAGLHSDRLAGPGGVKTRIVPFRGEYYMLGERANELVRGMIYPVPDPRFPFLGVHFTRSIHGGVEAGPNAVLALRREGYSWSDVSLRDLFDTLSYSGFWRLAMRYWRTGFGEIHRSLSKRAFTRALQHLVPDVRGEDLTRGGAGVRAQALGRDGRLVDDFVIVEDDRVVHVLNAPSPAATASLAIAEKIYDVVKRRAGAVATSSSAASA